MKKLTTILALLLLSTAIFAQIISGINIGRDYPDPITDPSQVGLNLFPHNNQQPESPPKSIYSNPYGFQTPIDVVIWVNHHIRYNYYRASLLNSGKRHYVQDPLLTLKLRSGVCIDYVYLCQYFIYRYLNLQSEACIVPSISHCILKVGDYYYDPTNSSTFQSTYYDRPIAVAIPYGLLSNYYPVR